MSWFDHFRTGTRVVRVAPVTFEHCDCLSEIHASAFARPWSPADFETFLTDGTVRVDGLFLGNSREPAGFVVARSAADEAEILSLALGRAARGQGQSRILLGQHLAALAHAGTARVHLEVEEGNFPALALYRRAGFVQSGHRPGYYLRPDGSRASALSMMLDLASRER